MFPSPFKTYEFKVFGRVVIIDAQRRPEMPRLTVIDCRTMFGYFD